MKTIKLSVADRINIEALFPTAAGRIEMTLVREMANRLTFTPEEVRDFQMSDGPKGLVRWNVASEQSIDLNFTSDQLDILYRGIKRIDEAGSVSLGMLALIEKIEA